MTTTSDRVLGVMALFSGERWRWTVEQAAGELGLPTSTAYRYFKSLALAEVLSPQSGGYYTLGPAICALDRAMRLHDPFITAARDEMQRLAKEWPDTIVLLTRLYKNTVMCVHREGEGLRADGYERGRPMPLHRGAASKAILAHLTPRHLRNLAQADGEGGPVNPDALRDELRQIKIQGYSVTRGEIDASRIGISVPVFGGNQTLEGSLSFVLASDRRNDEAAAIEALVRSRKLVEGNLLVAELQAA